MNYKCLECGHIFEEGEQKSWYEPHGELWDGCPICNGQYEEARSCQVCGGVFLEEELNGACVCDECINEYREDLDTCLLIGEKYPQKVSINSVYASLFEEKDIDMILNEYVKTKGIKDLSDFIDKDKSWFADKLAEEVNK